MSNQLSSYKIIRMEDKLIKPIFNTILTIRPIEIKHAQEGLWGRAKSILHNDPVTSIDVACINHREIIALDNNGNHIVEPVWQAL